MYEQSVIHICLEKGRPRYYTVSHTARHVLLNINSAVVNRRWGLLFHARKDVRWLVLSVRTCQVAFFHVAVPLSFKFDATSDHNQMCTCACVEVAV